MNELRRLWLLVALFAVATLPSCGTMMASGATECKTIFAPITWSLRDTPETVQQIKEHNAVWNSLD